MRVLYLYGSLSAREMKSQKFDARTNGCLQELISIIDLDQINTITMILSHTPCLSGALFVEQYRQILSGHPPGRLMPVKWS